MSDTVTRAEPESSATDSGVTHERKRWTRAHSIWLLIVLSLLPGVVVALERELWTALPAGFRAAIYLTSAALIVAACALIMIGGETRIEVDEATDRQG